MTVQITTAGVSGPDWRAVYRGEAVALADDAKTNSAAYSQQHHGQTVPEGDDTPTPAVGQDRLNDYRDKADDHAGEIVQDEK